MNRALNGVVVLVLAACASAPGKGGDGIARVGNVITAAEIAGAQVVTAAEVVERLRPNWLRARGAASVNGGTDLPIVYIDNFRAGGLEQLGRIAATVVREIRFVPGTDAGVRYGLGHGGGVILVLTREGGSDGVMAR